MTAQPAKAQRLAAIDLGAESGRVVVGAFDGERMRLSLVHRFADHGVTVGETRRWNLRALRDGISDGLRRASADGALAAIGVDGWAVDYALIDRGGRVLEQPYQYRDARTSRGAIDEVRSRIGDRELFARTGVRALPFNTIYQLTAHHRDDPMLLDRAQRLLLLPDLVNAWLSGVAVTERTNASTTGLCAAGACAWDDALIATLGLARRWFAPLVDAGSVLGRMRGAIAHAIATSTAPLVIAPATHDTASAVAGIPELGDGSAFISCGTWSLVGVLRDQPLLSEAARCAGFSNELAADGRTRLLRNVMGLWIVQECRRAFSAAGRERSYAELSELAAAALSPSLVLDCNDARFFAPGTDADPMPSRVRAWYRERGAPAPSDDGAIVRAVLDGLAEAVRRCCVDLRTCTAAPVRALHVVGGGAANRLLTQLIADRCGVPVFSGPIEATALGNLLLQARALGLIGDERQLREVRARSCAVVRYQPGRSPELVA